MTNETLSVIASRRSHRAYQRVQITPEQLDALLTAAKESPSAMNRQPWHFTVVQNETLLNEINDAARQGVRSSQVGGGVSTVNGAIGLVGTEVTGDVKTVNGDVTIGTGSKVRGGLTIDKPSSNWFPVTINRRSPRVIIGPDAVVEGPLEFKREAQ